MLSAAVAVPLAGAAVLALARGWTERAARLFAIVATGVPAVLLVAAWLRFDLGSGQPFQLVEEAPWIPTLGVAWRVGVDGISLPVATMAALLFVAAVAYPEDYRGRPRQYFGWFLFLDAASLGLFLTLDLLVFYVFFDLSLVGMYFLIGRWGHADAQRAALKFFLYTFAGSLVMLLAILALYLATDPLTFDMAEIIAQQPLAGQATRAGLTLLGFAVGLGIKTPLFPVHTWLPPAHVEAPAPASAILAGVLLKMGTYGLVRIPLSMMRDTFSRYALLLGLFAVASIVYGALVAFGQNHLKRRIAYTSVNHMGYAVLGIAAAGALPSGQEAARQLALTGATVEMVAHGLVTGSLFLITGSFWRRAGEYDMDVYGGLASRASALTGATVLAAFASLGIPGLAHFVAEFQIFVGTFAVYPWLAGIGLLGVLVTAALFLQLLQKVFFGDLPERWAEFRDLVPSEAATLGLLLALVVVVGVFPRWLLDTIQTGSALLVATP
ncbi:MAG TPA: NADH-quinone oxidoreductase subunit M [Egibacteraceae bacterium]|nr:NADH-quinone oxidoreductase subunit M [Actinomycetota bacterium]HWB71980.1 NADH-quinone oxidoreductase subunit M [Egibacteraceae bacterium]